ncbi:LuxR C-terminal-related transcriptional regulator [Cellulomonas sp.]|uniref:helix-turn-helix transcriptional regulator n=1 Tax=Cellulomonas sp. TaxID=40001 RepID=UPI0025C50EC2|nr:LuxR C-terminal-related transcriptional regulator [Cellulomonas sp.]
MSAGGLRARPTALRAVPPAPGSRARGMSSANASRIAAGDPADRRAVGQMCVVVSNLADGDGQILVRNLRRRGTGRVILLARRASRPELVGLLTGGLRGAIASESHASIPVGSRGPSFPTERPDLTVRELGVLRLVADGCSNRAVGEHLGLSALTVKSHLARISRKLGTGDRAALVAISIRSGMLD